MKYKNVEIGDKPTKEQFQEYVSKAGFLIDVDYWYDKYDKRNWLTKNNTEIKSLETIVNVINGIVVQRRKHHRDTNTGKAIKQPLTLKKATKAKKEKMTAENAIKLSFDERINLYEKIDSIPNKGRTKRQKLIRKALKRSFTVQELQAYKKRKRQKYYENLLKDERWKLFRLKVMSERGCSCEYCGSTEIIQIHHTEYVKGRLPWEYDIKDMRVLCKRCHQRIHNIQ